MRKKRQYERLIKQAETDRELTRLAGQITNLRKGNIEQAELISGKDLLPPVDPIEVERERRAREVTSQPISRAIEEVRNEVAGLRPAIENTKPTLPAIDNVSDPENQLLELEYPQPSREFTKAEYVLTQDEKELLKNQKFNPDVLYYDDDHFNMEYEKLLKRIRGQNISLGIKKRDNYKEKITVNSRFRNQLKSRANYVSVAKKTGRGVQRSGSVECPILEQITTRAKVLIGEINAGNTSQDLRNELSRILLILYKNKRISKAEYRRFAKL